MTNKDKYKQAFSVMATSNNFNLEVEKMKKIHKQHQFKTLVASIAACVILVGSSTYAYAADIGGIQRTLQLWIHGDQTEVTIQFNGKGSYNMNYTDHDGTIKQQRGGGVSFAPDGTEIPATQEELLEQLTSPVVRY